MKACKQCLVVKSLDSFNSNKNNKDGRISVCKPCHRAMEVIRKKTKKNKVFTLYSQQKSNAKKRGMALPTYTKKELLEWCMSQELFHKLYDNWKRLDYQKDYAPSPDRIDESISYTIANLELKTWRENSLSHNQYRKDGINNVENREVLQFSMDGEFIKKHYSIAEAARVVGVDNSSIVHCCRKKKYCHSRGGFKWKYADEKS